MKQNIFQRLFCNNSMWTNGPPLNASNNHQVTPILETRENAERTGTTTTSTITTSSGTSCAPIKNKHARRVKISFNSMLSRFKTKFRSYPEDSQHNNTLTNDWMKSPLHFACENGLSTALITKLLRRGFKVTATEERYGWAPLHSVVYCICEGHLSLRRGMRVIRVLCEIDTSMIHKSDEFSNAPLDLVHETMISQQMSTRNKRSMKALQMLYCELKQISINEYRQSKQKCEDGRRRNILHKIPSEHEEDADLDILSATVVVHKASPERNCNMGMKRYQDLCDEYCCICDC